MINVDMITVVSFGRVMNQPWAHNEHTHVWVCHARLTSGHVAIIKITNHPIVAETFVLRFGERQTHEFIRIDRCAANILRRRIFIRRMLCIDETIYRCVMFQIGH